MSPQDDLFDESTTRRSRLEALYKITGPVTPREFTVRAVRAGIWPEEEEEDILVKARLPEVRQFFDYVHPITGLQTGVKTQTGVRKPHEDALELDLEFDILEDVKAARADRERVRQKIRVMKNRCEGRRPMGLPGWIWNDEDDREWEMQRAA